MSLVKTNLLTPSLYCHVPLSYYHVCGSFIIKTQTQKVYEINKQTNKMSNNNEGEDDQPQNITDEMEQKRLEEAAASVE